MGSTDERRAGICLDAARFVGRGNVPRHSVDSDDFHSSLELAEDRPPRYGRTEDIAPRTVARGPVPRCPYCLEQDFQDEQEMSRIFRIFKIFRIRSRISKIITIFRIRSPVADRFLRG